MIKYFIHTTLFLFLLPGCNQNTTKEKVNNKSKETAETRIYSKTVNDSFSIFMSLPNEYNNDRGTNYPVVYLLDANLYFDILAATLKKYSEVGLAPSVILVGIGYKDFPTMDSLRNRDDTYPVAIPEYEMNTSGGADKFLSFISGELIPYIDSTYKTDTAKCTLMGHSLGGYFTSYALLQHLRNKTRGISNFIAASPSLHYNHYYLLNELKTIPKQQNGNKKYKVYITYGGLEETEDSKDSGALSLKAISQQLSLQIASKEPGSVIYKNDIFSNLDHMDTQIPTFIKGLQWMLLEQ